MTQPAQQQPNAEIPGSNPPPNPAPAHAQVPQPPQPTQPARPVVVQQPADQSVLDAVRALPEQIVHAIREGASQSLPPAAQQSTPQQQQQVQQQQQQTHQDNVQASGHKGPGRVASWYLGLGKR